jgi:periplasmic divalent cation tolerance protein
MTAALIVLCTAPAIADRQDRLGAEALARALVEEGLCACVNLLPGVRSVFRWQGNVDTAEETLLVLKTTTALRERLRARIAALHPYEVPEILEVAIDGGLPAYLQWLCGSVTTG